MHKGVLKDLEARRKRKAENIYTLQRQIDFTKELKNQDKTQFMPNFIISYYRDKMYYLYKQNVENVQSVARFYLFFDHYSNQFVIKKKLRFRYVIWHNCLIEVNTLV